MSISPPRVETGSEHRTGSGHRRVRLFGFTLASDFPFATRLADSAAEPDLTFSYGPTPPFPAAERLPPCRDGSAALFAHLARTDRHDVLRFPGHADFYIAAEHVFCHLFDPARRELVEIRFLGPVLAVWLERRGIPALHASAVVVAGRAAVFLSSHHGGKTALAAALMQSGCALLTDDILPVEEGSGSFAARPGVPQMRMWPDAATHFLGSCDDLEIVHPDHSKRRVPVGAAGLGSFCGDSRPLGCLYLPERQPSAADERTIEITPISPRDAVIELVRHSFAARILEATGWQSRRLDFFSRLVRQVPMRRLVYSGGLDLLPAVSAGILDDLTAAPSGLCLIDHKPFSSGL